MEKSKMNVLRPHRCGSITVKWNCASICLEVGGIEHILLIRETDYPKLCTLLVELNRAQSERLEEMQNRQNQNSIWY